MNQEHKKIFLKKGKEESVRRRHPWIFSGAIDRIDSAIKDGNFVDVLSQRGEFLGMGHYQSGSGIAVRFLSFVQIDEATLWRDKIRQAWVFRQKIGITDRADTNVFRLIFGEGDGLSGLIVDFYDGVAVMQAHSVGMYQSRTAIAAAIQEVLDRRLEAIYDKRKETLHGKAGEIKNEYILGEAADSKIVLENGKHFLVNWVTGQKTGFFIDQRENRSLVG
ncbi:MAG TPA: class I SAM-dependent rRNA methyltransferase, partial [Candidatus Cloacimonadota bacterium]|nr:class I SAM-dependent rRNA methyltransferase [Candidatus Cloacimonadota bacterium]